MYTAKLPAAAFDVAVDCTHCGFASVSSWLSTGDQTTFAAEELRQRCGEKAQEIATCCLARAEEEAYT